MIRDEVHVRVRGLLREGFTNSEIMQRVGCDNATVAKQRKKLGIERPQMIDVRKKRERK